MARTRTRTNHSQLGFTLVELMSVVAIISIVAGMAIPNVLSARIPANESAAVSTLRAIAAAQHQFQLAMVVDTDGDGGGEYGFIAELAGAAPPRDYDPLAFNGDGCTVGADLLDPPFLPTEFGNIIDAAGGGTGIVERRGYYFRVFLPDRTASGLTEAGDASGMNAADAGVGWSPDNCEIFWCAYAWPVIPQRTGTRTFFINQEGDVIQTANTDAGTQFGGQNALPAWNDAYMDMGDMESQVGLANVGLSAPMGRIWTPTGD